MTEDEKAKAAALLGKINPEDQQLCYSAVQTYKLFLEACQLRQQIESSKP